LVNSVFMLDILGISSLTQRHHGAAATATMHAIPMRMIQSELRSALDACAAASSFAAVRAPLEPNPVPKVEQLAASSGAVSFTVGCVTSLLLFVPGEHNCRRWQE
jgi:hypothetical protein